MMYADDLIIFLGDRPTHSCWGEYGQWCPSLYSFSGPKDNQNKTAAIVQNCGGLAWAKCFGEIGVDVKNFVKYLGVRFRNIRHHQDD